MKVVRVEVFLTPRDAFVMDFFFLHLALFRDKKYALWRSARAIRLSF